MSRPVILITGRNGQLGSELAALASTHTEFDFLFTDLDELDITNKASLLQYFADYTPTFCINAAAYTAVDKAETAKEVAMLANADAVGILAAVCKEYNCQLIHISTDYVFDGTASAPYEENNPTDPVNYYGLTKLKGEQLAQQHNPETIIIRTSWVYSSFGNNFVKTMMRLMSQKDSISVVSDQLGSPTYAADLASAIYHIIEQVVKKPQGFAGIYHYSNDGIISWFDFAAAIKEMTGSPCKVNPIATSGYPTPAKRPAYSGLSKQKIVSAFNLEIPHWKSSLQTCIDLLQRPAF